MSDAALSNAPGPGAREFPAIFEREYGCDMADWLRWLPLATPGCELAFLAEGQWRVQIGAGHLLLSATALPPRQIALIRLARMQVRFEFCEVRAPERNAFMRRFDMATQRGGG